MKGTKVRRSEKRKMDDVKPAVSKEERANLKALWNQGEQLLKEMGRHQQRVIELSAQYAEKAKEQEKIWGIIMRTRGLDPKKKYNIAPDGTIIEWGNDFKIGGESK